MADTGVCVSGVVVEVRVSTFRHWVEVGLLKGRQVTRGAPWRIVVTKQDMQRLKPTEPGEDWLPLKSTARKLGISQQTVLQKVKSGELEGVRVRVGRRVGWRIRLPQESYDITKTYLEERGMDMNTPVGMIRMSPMAYEDATEQVEKYMTGETKEMGYLEPPKDRDWTKPPQQLTR